ncbi:MAG TPA: NUDIX hydrolase [Steroidobacteraceae bacterium]|jgi:ADP-ribose pyrophosphatase YjhB (NUDIX family)|nr:NUDIX hydrolase [Steroidobacteraceae bacterium]
MDDRKGSPGGTTQPNDPRAVPGEAALPPDPEWLTVARELRAMAQTGLAFTQDRFDRQRYLRLRELAGEMLARGTGGDTRAILEVLGLDEGYATPKVDVRGAAFIDGRVLMVREITDGRWTLPGGWADIHQSPMECVVREILEESGFEARALKLAAVRDYQRSGHPRRNLDYIYKLFFICEITGGEARPSDETSEVAFFARDVLPPLSLGRVIPAEIEEMFRHAENMALPTYFE